MDISNQNEIVYEYKNVVDTTIDEMASVKIECPYIYCSIKRSSMHLSFLLICIVIIMATYV